MISDYKYIYEFPYEVKKLILLEAKNKGLNLRDVLNFKISDISVNGLIRDIPVIPIYYNYEFNNSFSPSEDFNTEGFLQYMKEEFPSVPITSNVFICDLVTNIIDFAILNKNFSANQMTHFLDEIIPEVTFNELQIFDSSHYDNLIQDIEVKFGDLDKQLDYIDNLIESAGITGNKLYSDEDVEVLLDQARKNSSIFNSFAEKVSQGKDLVVLKSAVENWDFSAEDFARYDSDVKEQFVRIMEMAKPEMDAFNRKMMR